MHRQDEFLRTILASAVAAQHSSYPGLMLAEIIDKIEHRLPALKAVAYENRDLSSGLSWDGKVICGDRKSIDAVKMALHVQSNVETFWRPNYIATQARLAKLKEIIDG